MPMHKRLRNAVLAAAAAGATVASAGLAGQVPAGAATTSEPAAIKTVIDTDFAGYVTGGDWRFRFVTADVPMAKCRSVSNQNADARIALKSNVFDEVAHIDLRCGGGHGSVRFGTTAQAEGHFELSPSVGDVLRISVYRNRAACKDVFVATNTKTSKTQTITRRTACKVVYRHAQLGATLLAIGVSPPARNVRLWSLRNTAMTSYSGRHGTICGPWPSTKHLAAPIIAVRMIPSNLTNSCRDFSVLLKGRS